MNKYRVTEIGEYACKTIKAESLIIKDGIAEFHNNINCAKREIVALFDTRKYTISIIEPDSKKKIIKDLKTELAKSTKDIKHNLDKLIGFRKEIEDMSVREFKRWRRNERNTPKFWQRMTI